MLDYLTDIFTWFQTNYELGLGIIITVIGFFLTVSEIRVYFKHDSPSEQLLFWVMFLVAGVTTIISRDLILGILLGISLLMIIETIRMWTTPVWGQLMAATTASYLVILGGRLGQVIYDYVVQPESPNDFIFATAFNVAFYVFLAVAFYFFGKKFILVSRFSSPQIVYLFLFGIVYVVIAQVFPRNSDNLVETYNYLGIAGEWRRRVVFADFGTFEALILVMIFMYFISGWLLTVLFGVKPVDDPEILAKVKLVAKKMGIEEDIKVGFVQAPILNAFAYGPWFDKRIAFISNDVNDFTDEDIKGIVGHELAHAANHHVLILLGLSILELFVKKIFLFPATSLDFTFLPDTAVENITFVGYYFFSYGIFIILMIFVRILEGHADKKTLEAGYGEDLSQALYRLEGFYNGVASDFGISVNLLTDRTYSEPEKRRFTAQAARNLYNEVISPTRGSALANIFQSHPRTSYRIASLVDPDINPMKAAFFSYRLLGFFQRKGAIKQLNSVESKFKEVIDKSYLGDYGDEALTEVMEFNPWKEPYFSLIGKEVIAYDIIEKSTIIGTFEEILSSNHATTPLLAKIGENTINLSRNVIRNYYPGEKYILKNGEIVTLNDWVKDEKGVFLRVTDANEKTRNIEIMKFGQPLNSFESLKGKEVVFFNKGVSQLATLDDFSFDENFFTGDITISGETFSGSNLIVSFPPLGFEIRKSKRETQMPLLQTLIGRKSLIFTRMNFDVSLAGIIERIEDQKVYFKDSDGEQVIEIDELEYVMTSQPTIELVNREHISLFTKIGIWWSNRKEFNYIF